MVMIHWYDHAAGVEIVARRKDNNTINMHRAGVIEINVR